MGISPRPNANQSYPQRWRKGAVAPTGAVVHLSMIKVNG